MVKDKKLNFKTVAYILLLIGPQMFLECLGAKCWCEVMKMCVCEVRPACVCMQRIFVFVCHPVPI